MPTLKEEAQAYTAPQTKNIADLEVVPTSVEVYDKEYTDREGKPFTMKVLTLNNEDYRVPVSVLSSLKEIIKAKPEVKSVKVQKAGEGLKTTYTVIPLD